MRARRIAGRTATVAVLALGGRATAQLPAYFHGLGLLAGDTSGSRATAISADGTTVVGYSLTNSHGFRWTVESGIVDLGTPLGGTESWAHAVSADGSIVVGTCTDSVGNRLAVRWYSGGADALGVLSNSQTSEGRGVSADGSVAVGWSLNQSGYNRAFRWTPGGGIQDLGVIGTTTPVLARAVSGNGLAIVGHYTTGNSIGYRLLGGNTVLLPHDPYALSFDGNTVVGVGGPGPGSGYRWTPAGGVQPLPYYAQAVSASGQVVVGDGGMYWTEADGMRDFAAMLQSAGVTTIAGWSNLNLTGVSADGLVVTGYGNSPVGLTEAWIARVAPPLCRADWTRDYVLSPADAAAFVTDWFVSLTGGTLAGDYDHNGVVQPSDVGAFISAWFAAVGGNCPP